MDTSEERRASPIFLVWAWGSVGIIVTVVGVFLFAGAQIPRWAEPVALTIVCGIALTGAIVAAGYVLSSFWMRAHVFSGVAALALNLGFLALVFAAPQVH